MTTRMFNVRLEDELWTAIEEAAQRSGLGKSVWAREVLAAAVYGTTSEKQPHPVRYLELQTSAAARYEESGECLHPPTAIQSMPFTDVCKVCGTVVKFR